VYLKKLLQILNKYLSAGSEDICRQIDSVKSDVEQLNQLCSETASSDNRITGTRYSGSLHKSLKLNKFEFLSRTPYFGSPNRTFYLKNL